MVRAQHDASGHRRSFHGPEHGSSKPESAQVFLKRMEEHVAENTGDPKETYDLMSTRERQGRPEPERRLREGTAAAEDARRAAASSEGCWKSIAPSNRGGCLRGEGAGKRSGRSEALWEKSLAKEKAQQEVLTRIEKEVEESVAKADKAHSPGR